MLRITHDWINIQYLIYVKPSNFDEICRNLRQTRQSIFLTVPPAIAAHVGIYGFERQRVPEQTKQHLEVPLITFGKCR